MADDADEPPPRLALLVAKRAAEIRDHEELVGPAALAEAPPPNLPPAGAAGKDPPDDASRGFIEQRLEPELGGVTADELAALTREQCLAGTVDEP